MPQKDQISIYIHWPFCESLCPYCDFNSYVRSSYTCESKEAESSTKLSSFDIKMLQAYKKEIAHHLSLLDSSKQLVSIFFGGGTPSTMHPEIVKSIIDEILSSSKITPSKSVEITLEANPGSSDKIKFEDFRSAGINRLSIGVQSFNDENLKFLGRKHNAKQAIAAIEIAKNVFSNFSIDIIYALPNQTQLEVEKDLRAAILMKPTHISAYTLTIEKGTPFFALHRDGKFSMPNEDFSADLYDFVNNFLEENKYHQYEISNYATSNHECVHNKTYWGAIDYVGIGPGAHGRITAKSGDRTATLNFCEPKKWQESCIKSGHAIQACNVLTKKELAQEIILMGLRTTYGINLEYVKEKFQLDLKSFLNEKNLQFLHENGFIKHTTNSKIEIPKQKLPVADEVCKMLLDT